MAVVERKLAKGRKTYGVSNEWQGKPVWEKVGSSRRQAESRDKAMKREIKAGTYVPKESAKALTVLQLAELWASSRTNASADEERGVIRRYIATVPDLANMHVGDVKHRHAIAWVEYWQSQRDSNGDRRLTDATIKTGVAVLRMVFRLAILREMCTTNPFQLPHGTLDTTVQRQREVYAISEMVVLMRHHKIPWQIRVLNALMILTGMRLGEACGRRWRDLDDSPKPLASLSVHDQYDGRPLKTENSRMVPVHPELHRILTEWATEGFELYTGSKPTLDDFIVPVVSKWTKRKCYSQDTAYQHFVRYAQLVGVRPRTVHALRHSFITHCRRANARMDVLEKVTHNAKGTILDRYTHWDWEPVCEAVLCLKLDAHQDLQGSPQIPGKNGGSFLLSIRGQSADLSGNSSSGATQQVGVSIQKPLATQSRRKTRQGERQELPQQFASELEVANRNRKRQLLTLEEIDPAGAAPGLAVCRALDAAYAGDQESVIRHLSAAELALDPDNDEGDEVVDVRGVA
jgi:integrase